MVSLHTNVYTSYENYFSNSSIENSECHVCSMNRAMFSKYELNKQNRLYHDQKENNINLLLSQQSNTYIPIVSTLNTLSPRCLQSLFSSLDGSILSTYLFRINVQGRHDQKLQVTVVAGSSNSFHLAVLAPPSLAARRIATISGGSFAFNLFLLVLSENNIKLEANFYFIIGRPDRQYNPRYKEAMLFSARVV